MPGLIHTMEDRAILKKKFHASKLYAITDLKTWSDGELYRIKEACHGGVDVIQLRSKVLDRKALAEAGEAIRSVTAEWNVLFIVNDYPDIALAVAADGVHLGQQDMPISEARKIVGSESLLIGKSTHSIEQAVAAENEGADYIGIGPIFSTPTKLDYPGVGLGLIREIKKAVGIPTVVIGGIDFDRLPSVVGAGAERIAVVRAIFGAADVFEATRKLKQAMENFVPLSDRAFHAFSK